MTAAELRAHYRISEATMHRWISAGCPHGRVPAGKNTRLFFKLSEVEDWLRVEQVA